MVTVNRIPAFSLTCCLLVTGCTSAADVGSVTSTTASDAPALAISEHQVRVDFGTFDTSEGKRVAVGFADPELSVGFVFADSDRPGPAVLEFPPLDVHASCLARAVLHVTLVTERHDISLAAYPARPESIPQHEGEEIPSFALLLDSRPRGTFEVRGAVAQADVTELVKTWLGGGPFPSQQMTVEQGAPLAIVVQPPTASSPETMRLYTSESARETAPRLQVARSC